MTYWLCGWRVRSDFALPDLLPWDDRADHPIDITIRFGEVRALTGPLTFEGPVMQIAASGVCRVVVPDVAEYLIDERGAEVTVAPSAGTSEATIRLFLLTTVFGVLCHQRGRLPLHAGCVQIGDDVIAFAGPSGYGKSTLAAALVQRGYRLVADDVAVIDVDRPGGAIVWPAFPLLKLWRDALPALNLQPEHLDQARKEIQRFHLPVAAAFDRQPKPLSAVYVLQWATDKERHAIVPVSGLAAVRRLRIAIYRDRVGEALGGEARLFATLGRVVSATPTFVLGRLPGLGYLRETVDTLLQRHQHADPPSPAHR